MTLPLVPLQQACAQDGWDYFTDFQFIEGISCTYTDPIGFLGAGLIVWAAVSLAIYTRQGSAIIPVVLLFIIGGVVTAQVAAPAMSAIVLAILVVPAGVMAYLYFRHSL